MGYEDGSMDTEMLIIIFGGLFSQGTTVQRGWGKECKWYYNCSSYCLSWLSMLMYKGGIRLIWLQLICFHCEQPALAQKLTYSDHAEYRVKTDEPKALSQLISMVVELVRFMRRKQDGEVEKVYGMMGAFLLIMVVLVVSDAAG
ncbi:hypothetical protein Tco_1019972 [Tanacetum coccineum]|uniref:Uncharacterized protein n=1 Tax=Tanacetum coccineum TaxID=301880 RepID=A0ABQ5FYT6_9ASTR